MHFHFAVKKVCYIRGNGCCEPQTPRSRRTEPNELKALIFSQHEQLLSKDEQLASRQAEIENLKLWIAKLRRMQFGRSSERLDRQIDQLECGWKNYRRARRKAKLFQLCLQ